MKYDVIIIGAGISGMTAARILIRGGLNVLILEAKNRTGGRIHTVFTSQGYPVELGAMLLQDLDLSDSSLETTLYHDLDAANRMIQEAKRIAWKKPPSLAHILMYHQDNRPASNTHEFLARQAITAMVEHHTGAPIDKVSLWELNTSVLEDFKQEIIDLLHPIKTNPPSPAIQLQSVVKEIHYSENEGVVITEKGKKYSASTILCTIPLGVLKQETVRFVPELSTAKRKAIQQLKVGHFNKIILEFEKSFWPENAYYLFSDSSHRYEWPEYLNLSRFLKGNPPLLIANFYAKAAQFKDMSDDQLIRTALAPLHKMYGKKVSPLKSSFVTHWDTEVYTLGSLSYCGLDYNPLEHEQLAEPEGCLYFAGEHTVQEGHGTVNGAYTSGLRAGLSISAYLKEQTKKNIKEKANEKAQNPMQGTVKEKTKEPAKETLKSHSKKPRR